MPKKKNVGRNELMLIRRPQLQFLEDGVKITATDTK